MVTYKKKYGIFKVTESWFGSKSGIQNLFGLKAYLHVKDAAPVPLAVKDVTYTIEIPLDREVDEILGSFPKNLRVDIRKAEEAGITTYFHNDIQGFAAFYNDFACKKQVHPISERRLSELGDTLMMSYAVRNRKILSAHSYILDRNESIVRAFRSATIRLEEDVNGIMVGRANKLLHFKDMVHFRGMGIQVYDFGGYAMNTHDAQLQGINNFKEKFGGEIVPCENYYSIPYMILRCIGRRLGILGEIASERNTLSGT
ncbi:MAG: hypothetical protein KGM98_02660 [Bacteroidota bacterium]|nr:hypothetical protein [Bacteroidota bacterium]